MAEIIVEAARDLYTDEEWAEIAQERITRCRDCAKRERNKCLWFRNWGHDFNGYCAWGEQKSEPVHKTHRSQRDSFHELIGWS